MCPYVELPTMIVCQILSLLYDKVWTLQKFLTCSGFFDGLSPDFLKGATDRNSYVELLETTLVASPTGTSVPTPRLSPSHNCHQNEVLLRAVERLKKGKQERNLLTLGFHHMSDDPTAQISSSPAIEYVYPNSNVSFLLQPVWKTLLQRIGDDIMGYLLETQSIFVNMSGSSCYVQLTGVAVHELWSYERHEAIRFVQPGPVSETKGRTQIKTRRKRKRSESPGQCPPSKRQHQSANSTDAQCLATSQEESLFPLHICRQHQSADTALDSTDAQRQSTSQEEGRLPVHTDGGLRDRGASSSEGSQSPCTNNMVLSPSPPQVGVFEGDLQKAGPSAQGRNPRGVRVKDEGQPGSTPANISSTTKENFHKPDCRQNRPYDPHVSVERSRIFYARDLREKFDLADQTGEDLQDRMTKWPSKRGYRKDDKIKDKDKCPIGDRTKEELAATFDSTPMDIAAGHSNPAATRESSDDAMETELANCDQQLTTETNSDAIDANSRPFRELQKIASRIVENHRQCRYHRMLTHYAPMAPHADPTQRKTVKASSSKKSLPSTTGPVFVRRKSTCSSSQSSVSSTIEKHLSGEQAANVTRNGVAQWRHPAVPLARLLEGHTHHRKVYLFVRKILRQLVPPDLLGSQHNWNVFLRHVSTLVSLGRFERLYLGQCMDKMKVTQVPWLKSCTCHRARVEALAKVVCWLLDDLVLNLLKSFFYLTDTTRYRNRMFYYRKRLWRVIRRGAVAGYLESGLLQEVSRTDVERWQKEGQVLGITQLRFLPKDTTMRPIVNMTRTQPLPSQTTTGPRAQTYYKQLSINKQLQDVLGALKYIRDVDPSLTGSSTFGADDIYKAWRAFVTRRKELKDERPLYFVKLDIEKCFDGVIQQKLFDLINDLMTPFDEFIVRRYGTVLTSGGKLKRTFYRDVNTLKAFCPDFHRFLRGQIRSKGFRNIIVVDQVLYRHESASCLLSKLQRHLFFNVMKIGDRFYRQTSGISQGSVLSSMLCNLYYGAMEREHLAFLQGDSDSLLMRQVDDFLLLTTNQQSAQRFLSVMTDGLPDYGCRTNLEKCLVNFHVSDSPVPVLPAGCLFPWCGLLLHPTTLEVGVDYSRYAGLTPQDTFTVDAGGPRPGATLRTKLVGALRPKCHGLFLDPATNAAPALYHNAYRVFLMSACRFCCYTRRLTPGKRVQDNPRFFFETILQLPRYFSRQMARKCHSTAGSALTLQAIMWLCLTAFRARLLARPGGFQKLLVLVKRRLQRMEGAVARGAGQRGDLLMAFKELGMPDEFTAMLG